MSACRGRFRGRTGAPRRVHRRAKGVLHSPQRPPCEHTSLSCRRVEPNYSRRMRAAAQLPAAIELTVLMPCLDEARTVATCVRKAIEACRAAGVEAEVLVADNGSSDGSPELARTAGARVIHVAEKGYGSALRAGIEAARGRFVVMGDADDSYEFEDVPPFLGPLGAGDELGRGSRFRGIIPPGAMPSLPRFLATPVLPWILNLFFGISPTCCPASSSRSSPPRRW